MLPSPIIHTCGSKIPRRTSDHSKASTSGVSSSVPLNSFEHKTSICVSLKSTFVSSSDVGLHRMSWKVLSRCTVEETKRRTRLRALFRYWKKNRITLPAKSRSVSVRNLALFRSERMKNQLMNAITIVALPSERQAYQWGTCSRQGMVSNTHLG